jgi:hypothetical protein
MSEEKFPGPIQISLAVAKEWKKRYEDETIVEDNMNKIKSYLIPRESLESVLKLEAEAVRAYIGINDQDEKALLFVGAKLDKETGKYIDVYGPPVNQDGAKTAQEIVYDGTRPSPPF